MNRNESIWNRSVDLPERERLESDLRADVAIIGAGMAGVLTAYQLSRQGVRAVVLEAGRAGGGQTGNTTAKITSQHGMVYDALIRRFGLERAAQYAQANQQAVEEYGSMIRDLQIDCDYREAPSYLYSTVAREPMMLEAAAASRLGIDATFTTETELPFPVSGAVCFERQARFHPLKFLKAVSRELEIYECTPVLAVEENRLRTARGTVTAQSIVFACHYPFVNVPGWYFMRMHQERSYVLALETERLPTGLYFGVDNDGLSLREADGLLLLGGDNHRTGENTAGGRYDMLLSRAAELYPGCREVARWSAQDCVTLDGAPYIGPFSPSAPGWYVATGFGKWGMSSSMAAAMLISGEILGHAPSWAPVFSPVRLKLSASAKSLATDTAQAFKGLARGALALPQAMLEALPRGHGGIVEADGQKAGVYKDETGQCYIVSPRCPHLGCQVEWNPDELSWDCPCHGSRFRFDGSLIDNPAQEGLV